MGYETVFNGHFEIRPMAPYKVVNAILERLHTRNEPEWDNLCDLFEISVNAAPGIYCNLEVAQGSEQDCTIIEPSSNGYNDAYDTQIWIDLVIDYIKQQNPEVSYTFEGYVTWDGSESDDNGEISIGSNGSTTADQFVQITTTVYRRLLAIEAAYNDNQLEGDDDPEDWYPD